MNKSIFIGRMATDPKVMSSAGKKTVAYFRIAVERNFKQEGAPNADYFSCVTFGERAEFVAKYFYKGKKIPDKDVKLLKYKIILAELSFKLEEDSELSIDQKDLMAALFTDVLIYNDLRDQRAIVYKRFKRVVEYIFSNYEIKPK